MKRKIGLTATLLAVAMLLSTAAYATLPMGKQYAAYYKCPTPKCALCHVDKKALNEYGEALKKALKGEKVITPEMFKACEGKRPKG